MMARKSGIKTEKIHREDGPAVIYPNSSESFWFLDGSRYSKSMFDEEILRRNSTNDNQNNLDGKIVVIDGSSYKLNKVSR